jgi:hypothetical protein
VLKKGAGGWLIYGWEKPQQSAACSGWSVYRRRSIVAVRRVKSSV